MSNQLSFPGGVIKALLDHDGEMLSYKEKQEARITAYLDKIIQQEITIDKFCTWYKLNTRCESCPMWQQGDDLKWRCTR